MWTKRKPFRGFTTSRTSGFARRIVRFIADLCADQGPARQLSCDRRYGSRPWQQDPALALRIPLLTYENNEIDENCNGVGRGPVRRIGCIGVGSVCRGQDVRDGRLPVAGKGVCRRRHARLQLMADDPGDGDEARLLLQPGQCSSEGRPQDQPGQPGLLCARLVRRRTHLVARADGRGRSECRRGQRGHRARLHGRGASLGALLGEGTPSRTLPHGRRREAGEDRLPDARPVPDAGDGSGCRQGPRARLSLVRR